MEAQTERLPPPVHPGPFCIKCKEPFGGKKPSGTIYNKGKFVSYSWYNTPVTANDQTFCLCYECLNENVDQAEQRLVAALTPEQLKIFHDFKEARNDLGSHNIAMS